MEAVGRGHVHHRVGMVDTMEAPEERDAMVQPVPCIHPAVHEQEHAGQACPLREPQPVEHAELMRLGPVRHGPPQADEHQPGHGRVEHPKQHVAHPVPDAFAGRTRKAVEERGE